MLKKFVIPLLFLKNYGYFPIDDILKDPISLICRTQGITDTGIVQFGFLMRGITISINI